MFIPFEPAIPFTLYNLIVWYMLMLMCGCVGVVGSMSCNPITYTKASIGFLCGIGFYYALSWLFQSRAAMALGPIFDIVVS
jgi:hypothetical protein